HTRRVANTRFFLDKKSPFIMGIHHYDIPIENSRQISHYSVKAEFTQVSMPSKGLKILTHRG
ncbi:MAG: hypothetical protein QXL10_04195, partial [Candidatus Bathyarchaeia archaeon]